MSKLSGVIALLITQCVLLSSAAQAADQSLQSATTSTAPQSAQSATLYSISPQDVVFAVENALKSAGAGSDVAVRVIGPNHDATYTYASPITMNVKELTFDKKAGTWSATLLFDSNGQPLAPAKVKGRFDEMMTIPTLKHRLFEKDVIEESDIDMQRISASKIRKNTVLDKSELIGRSPIRIISEGRPIRSDEISSPAIIRKGAQVTMRFISGNLSIDTQGEALDDGAVGEKIRVRNTTSNKVVQVVVQDKNTVIVESRSDIELEKAP